MIDDIFEMIMKEARRRKGESLEIDAMIVLLQVTHKVFDTIEAIKVEDIKSARPIFRRKKQ